MLKISLHLQLHFIRYYLETVQRETAADEPHRNLIINPSKMTVGPKAEARLLREADCYMLASHFFWGLWAVVNAPVSSIPFGYWVRECCPVFLVIFFCLFLHLSAS